MLNNRYYTIYQNDHDCDFCHNRAALDGMMILCDNTSVNHYVKVFIMRCVYISVVFSALFTCENDRIMELCKKF